MSHLVPGGRGSRAATGHQLDLGVSVGHIRLTIDWARVEGFECDEGNARKSSDRHGVSQAEAEQVLFNQPLLVVADPRHSVREPRFHALWRTDAGRLLHVTFTLRGAATLLRMISALEVSRKERGRHAQES